MRKTYILVCLLLFLSFFTHTTYAAQLVNTSDILTRVKAGVGSSHLLMFSLSTSNAFDASETITVDFGEDTGGWVVDGVNSTLSDFNFQSPTQRTLVGLDGDCTDHIGVNDVAISIDDTQGTISFTACSGFVSDGNGSTVSIAIGTDAGGTDRVANPAIPGTYELSIGGSFGDTGELEIQIVGEDQIAVSGVVDEVLQFSISDDTIGFGEIDYATSRYASGDGAGGLAEIEAHTLVASANATDGYSITVSGNSLQLGGSTIDPIGGANTLPVAGVEQFGIRMTATGGAASVSSPYSGVGFAYDGVSTPDEVAFSAGASNTTTFSVRYLLSIHEDTVGGIYTTALTYEMAALF